MSGATFTRSRAEKSGVAAWPLFPWSVTHLGGVLNTCVWAPARRVGLGCWLAAHRGAPDTVSVLVGLRNRPIPLLRNALQSIRAQQFPADAVDIIVVDYGSRYEEAEELMSLVHAFRCHFVRVAASGPWNKAHCLNIGIRNVTSTFLLSTDADIVFQPNYLAEAVSLLRRRPLSVVYSRCLDLGRDITDAAVAGAQAAGQLDRLREAAEPRSSGDCNAGINMTYTRFYHFINGYDEFYEGWGSEDNDLQRRFELFGLRSVSLNPVSVYFHQWHPRAVGSNNAPEETLTRNLVHFDTSDSIVRNRKGWGRLGIR